MLLLNARVAFAIDFSRPVPFDVPSQTLSAAIAQFAAQADLQFTAPSTSLTRFQSGGVRGTYIPTAALTLILRDTGLTYRVVDEGTVAITRLGDADTSGGTAQEGKSGSFRLLRVAAAENTDPPRAARAADEQLEEVVVTGTLLQPSGFTTPTPVTVIGQDVIAARAPSDASELLREIPSLKISSGPAITGAGQRNSVGQSSVNFYGLTPARTLVLIDGQRQAPTEISSSIDVSTIPTLMIERIETITGGASATYGSDAVAGVANFILRNKIDGVTVNASFGMTDHRDKQVSGLNLGFGTDLGSRANLVIGVDLTRDTGIDSLYSRDWGRKEPGLFVYGNVGAARGAQPQSAWVNNYEQKNNTPGGNITGCTPAPCPASLAGMAFDPNGNLYSFIPGTTTAASTFMYGNTSNFGNDPNGQSSLSAAYKRWTGLAKLNIDVTDETKLRLTVGYSGMTGEEQADVVQNTTTVTTSNPFLPTAVRNAMTAAGKTSITVGRTNYDLGYDFTGQVNRLFTAGAQLTGPIAGSWRYDGYYKFSEATSDAWQNGFRTADINAAFSNCTVTTGASPGCVGYNIFGVGQASQAALNYLTQYTQGYRLLTKQNVVQALVRGTAFATWAGDVNVAVGAHYRNDAISRTLARDSVNFPAGGFSFGNYSSFAASRNVKEYFGEANVPLVKGVPVVQALDLNLGYRYLDYSDDGSWNTWKAGLTWELNDQVRVRATRSRDIRAPHLFQQYGNGSGSLVTNATDPRTGQIIVVGGGGLPTTAPAANPTLRPEVAATTTAGVILQPHWVPGLRMSVDYFRININDVITSISSQQVLNGCLRDGATDLCQFITFSGPGQTGAITSEKLPNVNLNQLDVAGYNGEVAYAIPGHFLAGNWDVRWLATYMDKYETTDRFTNLVYNDIGTPTAGQPRLQTNLLLTYKHADFSTTLSWRYFHGVKYSSSANGVRVGPDDPLYYSTVNSTAAAPCPGGAATCPWYQTASNSISQNRFPGASYLNWSAQYQFEHTRVKGLQLYVKVDNVLDKDPPEFAYAAFGAANLYDLLGRNYKIGVRANF